MIKKPAAQHVVQFISETHQVEDIPVTSQIVSNTMTRKEKNIFAHGHLQAISYAINTLLPSPDYPARNIDFKDIPQFESNVHWLKHLNSLLLSPLIADTDRQLTLSKIGIWRTDLASNIFTAAPHPTLIPYVMFNWLKKLTNIHQKVKDKLDNPYGLTQDVFVEMKAFSSQQPVFFSTVQPFKYDNNRFGRFMENVILLGWNIPMKYSVISSYEQFKDSLDDYQRNDLQKIIHQATELKSRI